MGEQQLQAHCRSTNPSLICTTSILLLGPPTILCFILSLFFLCPSSCLTLAALASALFPLLVCLKYILLFRLFSGQNRQVVGSNKTEQQGWVSSTKVIRAHAQTQLLTWRLRWSPMGLEAISADMSVCVLRKHFMCSCSEGGKLWDHTHLLLRIIAKAAMGC